MANSMNKYEILGIIGEGAYGIVYKAKHKDNGDVGKYAFFSHSNFHFQYYELSLHPFVNPFHERQRQNEVFLN